MAASKEQIQECADQFYSYIANGTDYPVESISQVFEREDVLRLVGIPRSAEQSVQCEILVEKGAKFPDDYLEVLATNIDELTQVSDVPTEVDEELRVLAQAYMNKFMTFLWAGGEYPTGHETLSVFTGEELKIIKNGGPDKSLNLIFEFLVYKGATFDRNAEEQIGIIRGADTLNQLRRIVEQNPPPDAQGQRL